MRPDRGGAGIVNQATETIMAEEASRQVLDRGVVGIRLPGFKKPRGCSYQLGDLGKSISSFKLQFIL